MKLKASAWALALSIVFILGVSVFFYPKWEKEQTEATISWDVSGYYLYLPATFIYKDIKELRFFPSILEKYQPTHGLNQAFMHRNGAYVLKYSCGQAIMYSPFFFTAHIIALATDYEADGFSKPYQFMISFGSLLIAFLGLFYLRKILLEYFSDKITAAMILIVVFGTNYLDYSAINGALTHNYLFTIYCLLIWQTISFYKQANLKKALFIGFLVGLAALTRPVEIISLIIPVLWGLKLPIWPSLKNRLIFFRDNFSKYAAAAMLTLLIGSIQLFYWKYSGGEWIIYSYEDQGFSWLSPHFKEGFFSFKSGWLVYTPVMIFAMIGFVPLWWKNYNMAIASTAFSFVFIYITFAWDIWWYGGSLGQRAMIQAYPVLAIPFAAFLTSIKDFKVLKILTALVIGVFIYFNLWLTYQAHNSGMYHSEQMTEAYFWKTAGRWELPEHALKLLDTNEEFTGERKNVQVLFETDFESDSIIGQCDLTPIQGTKSLCLNDTYKTSEVFFVEAPDKKPDWICASADFRIGFREWDYGKMTQFMVRFYQGEKIVKEKFIRVYRTMYDGETQTLFFDTKSPEEDFDQIGILFKNNWGDKPILVDNLKLEGYEE